MSMCLVLQQQQKNPTKLFSKVAVSFSFPLAMN